jgi:RNA polymerase sigma factor (sigma-70 family)
METEDSELIRETLRGNQHAYRRLVERYQHFVFTAALRVLGTREDAEEAAQDTFVKAYRTLGRFQGKAKFSTWLYTIAYRTALDRARAKKIEIDSVDDDGYYRQIADESDNAEEEMEKTELHELLRAGIERLPPRDASIITLFYLQECSVQEIAKVTGLSVTNIKTKLHRLRERLRQDLAPRLQPRQA